MFEIRHTAPLFPFESDPVIRFQLTFMWGFPGGSAVKNSPASAGDNGFDPWVRKIPWRRKWQPAPAFLPEKFHGQRGLIGYSLWGYDLMTK